MKKFYVFEEDGHDELYYIKSFVARDNQGFFLCDPRTGRASKALRNAATFSKLPFLENAIKTDPIYFGFKPVPIRIQTFRELESDLHKEYKSLPLDDSFVP